MEACMEGGTMLCGSVTVPHSVSNISNHCSTYPSAAYPTSIPPPPLPFSLVRHVHVHETVGATCGRREACSGARAENHDTFHIALLGSGCPSVPSPKSTLPNPRPKLRPQPQPRHRNHQRYRLLGCYRRMEASQAVPKHHRFIFTSGAAKSVRWAQGGGGTMYGTGC